MSILLRMSTVLLLLCSVTACNDKAKEHKDELREGTWYVYDIEYDYQFYNKYGTPELASYIHWLLDERNLLFLPGDELAFSKSRITVRCPDNDLYSYHYYFWGKYIRIRDGGADYPVNPNGDDQAMRLRLDKTAQRQLLSEAGKEHLANDLDNNLKRFHIDYLLQRPLPPMAQIMAGTYEGQLYDGTNQLLNEHSLLYLFWENNKINLSLEDKVNLAEGPSFYLEVADLVVKEGFTPGSYTFSGRQRPQSDLEISVSGRVSVNHVVEMDVLIQYGTITYELHYEDGMRQWDPTKSFTNFSKKPL